MRNEHDVEVLIGRRMRSRRVRLELTMAQVGRQAGLSFQQIQKYETGLCSIAASRLWSLSQVLSVDVSYFYAEAPAQTEVKSADRRFEPLGATFTQHP